MNLTSPRHHRNVLMQLATEAVLQFIVEPTQLRLLSNKEHAVFRVERHLPDGLQAERFALRLYRPDAFHEPSVFTELEWLDALTRHLGRVVPQPIPALSGRYLVRVDGAGTEGDRSAALFHWVSGRRRNGSLTPTAMMSVGRLVARMHEVSATFRPSFGADTQRWDWERVFGPCSPVGPDADSSVLTSEQHTVFARLSAHLKTVMDALGTSSGVWGIIHGDLHTSNYLFAGPEARAIDFEDCGWGFYLYDLAVILDEIYVRYPSRSSELRQGLIEGYRSIRSLPTDHEALLDVFVGMRLAELVRWHAQSADAAHRAVVPELIGEAVNHIRQLTPPG